MQGKCAIVGNSDSIMLFKATGVDAYPAQDEKTAKDVLRKVAKDHKIIFITEEIALTLGDFLKRFDEEPYPVVLVIPSGKGESTYGYDMLKDAMERALGVDILFNRD